MHSAVTVCNACTARIKEPFIRCAVCVPLFTQCLPCFSKGYTNGVHESYHDYEIVRSDFNLFAEDWTAAEELKLLEAVDDCGFGNWSDVSKCVGRPSKECENHYVKYYVDEPQLSLFRNDGSLDLSGLCDQSSLSIPYIMGDEPPRPLLDSQKHIEMAGYSASRGDFVTEYDQFAEMNVRDLEFNDDDDSLDRWLKLTEIEMYNNKLRERAWRKSIIRNFGLIDIQKCCITLQQYENVLDRSLLQTLRHVMHLLSPDDFSFFTESFGYECDLRQRILLLQEYRKAGLQKFFSIKLYHKLKQKRDDEMPKRNCSLDTLAYLKNEGPFSAWSPPPMSSVGPLYLPCHSIPRKSAPPLDITGLPGYEKLDFKEKELCSLVRLVPDAYLEFKSILINENLRNGYVKLAQARQMIKIDVNKTRKLYDFLVQEGLICKDVA